MPVAPARYAPAWQRPTLRLASPGRAFMQRALATSPTIPVQVFFVAPQPGSDETAKAKLMLVLLAFAWGLSWPAMKIALDEVGVWGLRFVGLSIGAASLFALIRLQRRDPSIAPGRARLHVVAASVVNVIGFGMFVSFAQLSAATSRVVIVNYSMPVWASLMAWLVLGERLDLRAGIGLVLCV